jgi:Tol biopolymer transport system component
MDKQKLSYEKYFCRAIRVFILLSLCVYSLAGCSGQHGWHIRRLGVKGDNPTWNTATGIIAFEQGNRASDTASEEASIYIVDEHGKGLKKICIGEEPTWSPNGKFLGYLGYDSSSHAIKPCIYETKTRRVRTFPKLASETRLLWAPNGKGVVYLGSASPNPNDPPGGAWLYLPLDKADEVFGVPRVVAFLELYGPSINDFAFGMQGAAYTRTLTTENGRNSFLLCQYGLESTSGHLSWLLNRKPRNARRPAWHPSKPYFVVDSKSGIVKIDMVAHDTAVLWRPKRSGTFEGQPFFAQFSPDGTKLAFVVTSKSGRSQIVCVDSAGRHAAIVAKDITADNQVPFTWGPGSHSIVFTSRKGELCVSNYSR